MQTFFVSAVSFFAVVGGYFVIAFIWAKIMHPQIISLAINMPARQKRQLPKPTLIPRIH